MSSITADEAYQILTATEGATDNSIHLLAVPNQFLGELGHGFASGFSFGNVQLDIGNNTYAQSAYRDILNLGLAQGELTQDDFNTLSQYNGVSRPDVYFPKTYNSARALANQTVFDPNGALADQVNAIVRNYQLQYLSDSLVPAVNRFLQTHTTGAFDPSDPDYNTALATVVSLTNRAGNLTTFRQGLRGNDDPTIDDVQEAWQRQLGNGASNAAWRLVQAGAKAAAAGSPPVATFEPAFNEPTLGYSLPGAVDETPASGVYGSLTGSQSSNGVFGAPTSSGFSSPNDGVSWSASGGSTYGQLVLPPTSSEPTEGYFSVLDGIPSPSDQSYNAVSDPYSFASGVQQGAVSDVPQLSYDTIDSGDPFAGSVVQTGRSVAIDPPDLSQIGAQETTSTIDYTPPSYSLGSGGSDGSYQSAGGYDGGSGGYDGGYSGGYSYDGGGGYGYGPVELDLTGQGIKINPLNTSNMFADIGADGSAHRTAWAGAGDGVLFLDSQGTGKITQQNQVVFTDWDPSAANDMQALEDVFDTNHDGKLDAGDADFSEFKILVTNADGTTTVETLAQAGITSINLTPSKTTVVLPDGSSIDGTTTFTKTDGTTGTAATVTYASDANGYSVANGTTHNADGSTTVANLASYTTGGTAFDEILNTSADGLTKTLTTLNAGGNVETIQTDVTVHNADGSTTETLTDYQYGTISASNKSGALGTSVSTSGAEKVDSTQSTTASSNGVSTTTILRDQLGGGWTTQKEIETVNADGSTSLSISNLNYDGSASNVTTSNVSANGLTNTTTALVDGVSADSTTDVDSTVVNGDGSRTQTVTDSVGTTTVSTAVTQISANGTNRVTSSDLDGNGSIDAVSSSSSTLQGDGSTTILQTDSAANGALIGATSTNTSANGLVTTTKTNIDGAGSVAAPAWDSTETKSTVYAQDQSSYTTTDTLVSANGSLRQQTVTQIYSDGVTRNISEDNSGAGFNDVTESTAVSGGVTTDTTQNWSGNGALVSEQTVSTSADGLTTTTSLDQTGATGTGGAPIYDHVTTDGTVRNADGSSVETVTEKGSAGSVIETDQTAISANGLVTTTSRDFTGSSGVADGSWDRITTDTTTVNADNSLSETIAETDGHGNVLETKTIATSADRRTVTTTDAAGTTGLDTSVETKSTASNGTVTDTIVAFDKNGDVTGATQVSTSADGLTTISRQDAQGQTAAAYASGGLTFDETTTDATVINANGSRTETETATSQNGTQLSVTQTTTSANGLTISSTSNPFATSHYASASQDITTINGDGSRTETVNTSAYNGALIDHSVTTTSATGLATTTTHDFDGDGNVDQTTTDATTVNADGSQTEVTSDYTGTTSGTLRDITTTTSGVIASGLGQETTTTRQSFGSVPSYEVETISPDATGTISDDTKYYATQGGSVLLEIDQATTANGLGSASYTALNGDTTWDFKSTDVKTINADGSVTETKANYNRAGLVSETVTTTSANGLWTTTSVDQSGALSNGNPVFDHVQSDDTVFNSDGSQTETVTVVAANGSTISKTTDTTSADGQTKTIQRFLDATGTVSHVDQSETTQTQANGSSVDTVATTGATGQALGTITTTTSGNGLQTTKVYANGSGTTTDTESDTTTYDANGDGGTLEDVEDADVVGSVTLKSSVKTQTSGNGQTATITTALSGALASTIASSFAMVATEAIAIADSGVKTTTQSDTFNAAAIDTETVTLSADGLVQTTSKTLSGGTGPYYVDQEATNVDGSKLATTTFYDSATPSLVLETQSVATSWDGRTITTTAETAYDQLNQKITSNTGVDKTDPASLTPTFSQTYDQQTDTYVENVDGSISETRSGTGSFGAPAYKEVITVSTNTDSSKTAVIQNFDANGSLSTEEVETTSANGLSTAFAYDTTGEESATNLKSAATALANQQSLPTNLLATDIVGFTSKVINSDGSTTTTTETAYGSSLSNLRSESIATTTANGLVTTTKTDNDGNGVFETLETSTTNADGSSTAVFDYYGDTSATATTLSGSNTYTTSANGLVTTLVSSTGITDTTTAFPDSNGSYEFSRVVTAKSAAATYGWATGSASHVVDANGVDTWSYNDGYGDTGTIKIDLKTEQEDVAIANQIFQTMLGHQMDDSETQYCGQYIVNGVFNREQQAYDCGPQSVEYYYNYGMTLKSGSSTTVVFKGFEVMAAFENALGRLPTAEEMGIFGQYMQNQGSTGIADNWDDIAEMGAAVSQYAAEQQANNFRVSSDANVDYLNLTTTQLTASAPSWIAPGANAVQIQTAGTYAESNEFIADMVASSGAGVTATINGNSNEILAYKGSVLTVNGYSNAIDVANTTATINTSNSDLMLEAGASVTVSGSNNQIAQVGPTSLTITSGANNTLYVEAGQQAKSPTYTLAYSTTSVSNAVIVVAAGASDMIVGSGDVISAANGTSILASNETIDLAENAAVTITGSSNTLGYDTSDAITFGANSTQTIAKTGMRLALGTGDVITASNDTISVAANATATVSGSGNTISALTGDALTASNDSIGLAANAAVAVTGSGNTVSGTSGNTLSFSANATDAVVGSGMAISAVNGDSLTASNDKVSLVANAATTLVGSGNTVTLANGDSLTASGDTLTLVANATDTVVGSGNTIAALNDDVLTASSDTISLAASATTTVTGSGDAISVATGDKLTASNDTISLAASATATITGSGNSISALSGDTLTASNDEIVFAANATSSLTGSGDQVTMAAGDVLTFVANDSDLVGGSGATVSLATGDTITFAQNATDAVKGSGATIGAAAGDVLTMAASASDSVSGSGATFNTVSTDTLTFLANATDAVTGSATLAVASGDLLTLKSGTATVSGSGATFAVDATDTLTFAANATDTLTGSGAKATLANGDGLTASNDSLSLAANATVTVTGSGNTISVANGGKLTASNDTISFAASATATVTGSGNQLALAASDVVTLSGNATDSVTTAAGTLNVTTGDVLTFAASATQTVSGSGATLNVASGDKLTFAANATDTVSGAGATLNEVNGDALTASSDTISLAASATASLIGSGNVVTAASGDTLTASNDTVSFSANATSTVTGSGNAINVATGDKLTASGDTFGFAANTTSTETGSNNTFAIAGSTTLTVSGSNDAFVYQPTFGKDTITGWGSSDSMQFSKSDFADWNTLLSHTAQSGSDTIITLDTNDTVTLKNVTANSLQSSQFRFV